ncbi:hypothetical protein M493_07070 [Geobacillus genomosp. 3]|uniref:Uncharacterized protein n=1 Tax=Geobacillus genomosp. 3 TaxID=1921421 RepID=S5ZMT8_GEOG3|nr:hypothetical protein M493_07070 [Geobacillus genomosp. 3]
MRNSIEKKLREKGIKCSGQELMMLEHKSSAQLLERERY